MFKFTLIFITGAIVSTCYGRNVGTHPIIPFKHGPCLNGSVMMENFELKKFFTGTWYLKSSYENDIAQEDGKCSGIKAKIIDDKVEVLFYHYDDFIIGRYTYVKGEANVKDIGSSFKLNIVFYPTTEEAFAFGILSTDYKNYAILYSCRNIGSNLSDEMVLTFTRKQYDSANDGEIEKALLKSGFKPEKFTTVHEMKCPSGEPTL